MDERRRRRLAVNGEGAEAADPGEEKSIPECVPAELCAASPWIPLARWKLWTIAGLLLASLVVITAMVCQTPSFRPELTPALDPLFRRDEPKLISYLSTMFWTLAGQLALLIGWHRSRSRLDFRGRYRVWPWAAAAMFFCGLCVATNLHVGLATIIDQLQPLESIRPRLGWMIPAVCLMLPLGMLMDRDVRRSAAAMLLLRTAIVTLMSGALLTCHGPSWVDKSMMPVVQQACGLFGSAFLMLAMWVQGWHVAYVTPDPPSPAPFRWPALRWNPLGWLVRQVLALFKRRQVVEEPAPRKRKRAEEATAPKRKRKTKRTAAKRSRPKVVEEEEAAEEDEDEEAGEEADEPDDEESESAEELSEDEEEELTRPAPVSPPAVSKPSAVTGSHRSQDTRSAAPPAKSPSYAADEEEDDEDQGETQWRIDGPSPDQLKGLSKKQRRALIKQHRDQQRNQR